MREAGRASRRALLRQSGLRSRVRVDHANVSFARPLIVIYLIACRRPHRGHCERTRKRQVLRATHSGVARSSDHKRTISYMSIHDGGGNRT
jgi:hypothetical protein